MVRRPPPPLRLNAIRLRSLPPGAFAPPRAAAGAVVAGGVGGGGYWSGGSWGGSGGVIFYWVALLGGLSDRCGRRRVLLWSLLGLGVHFLLLGLAPSLALMFVARFVGGAAGASFSVANAYASDVSTAEQRAKSFGLIGAAFGLGFIFGPMIGGLLGSVNLHLPFYAAACLSLVTATSGFFVVPESLPRDRRAPFSFA